MTHIRAYYSIFKLNKSIQNSLDGYTLASIILFLADFRHLPSNLIIPGLNKVFEKQNRIMIVKPITNNDEIIPKKLMQNIDGIVFSNITNPKLLNVISKKPCVKVFGNNASYNFDHVTYDHNEVGILAADYFVSKGLKTVGVIKLRANNTSSVCAEFFLGIAGNICSACISRSIALSECLRWFPKWHSGATRSVCKLGPERTEPHYI